MASIALQLEQPPEHLFNQAHRQGGFYRISAHRFTDDMQVGQSHYCVTTREALHLVNQVAKARYLPEVAWIDLSLEPWPLKPLHRS